MVTIFVLNGNLAAASVKALIAVSLSTPVISKIILPGLIFITHSSTLPLPLPILTPTGFAVKGLSGNTLIQIFPVLFIVLERATLPASICLELILPSSIAFSP
ncbi:ribosomal protein [Caminibacter mediatlanticus TB-2]|uniref:Ribosomal protein n=1 Tax=Caminibacter mediatlanticus TB-2 TaxID=391592 RepID=A0AAI9AEV3_9BACT|nr:ribosomal protein [Caminibacter mediatlanticus TB-2]